MANKMISKALALLAGASALALPITAQAHRQWLLPVATTYSGDDPWASVTPPCRTTCSFPTTSRCNWPRSR
jgi:hypothetical protein